MAEPPVSQEGISTTNQSTAGLLRALGAVNQRIPEVIRVLATGDLSAFKQHQFASLLIDLGELLHHHADSHSSTAGESRRAVLEAELPAPNREDELDDS